jgi:hypothetical protein
VTDADETFRQNMEKEAPRKLSGRERHHLLCGAVRIVFPMQADLFSIESGEAMIRDGDPVRVLRLARVQGDK